MAKFDKKFVLLISSVILIISLLIPVSECSKKSVRVARKEDIPYIKCQVCKKLAHQLYHQVQVKQAQISPKKISEYQIIEISKNVCNLKKQEADWILKIDIVEQGDSLELVDQDSEGQCNSECKTIERACQEVMGYSGTDVAEYLYKKKPQIDSLVKFLCKDLTGACSTKPPKVPKDRTPGKPFVAKSSKEAEMERMLKSMEVTIRDYMHKHFGDADDEDDDDETQFPSNTHADNEVMLQGKILKEKENKKNDWKPKITKAVADAGETVKTHANKVSHRVRGWWNEKKAVLNKNSKPNKAEL